MPATTARPTSWGATHAYSAISRGFGSGSSAVAATYTGHTSFSTVPFASVARYRNSGRASSTSVSSMPSSNSARRRTAAASDSAGLGCPQNEFDQTPGQACFESDRRVTSTSPSAFTTWHEKARCSAVSGPCAALFGARPTGEPDSSRRTTSSSIASMVCDMVTSQSL